MDSATDFPAFVDRWNETQGLSTPDLHRRIARWLDARWHGGDRRLLLMAFRNSGKSTLLGLFCAWLLHIDPNRRILALGADLPLARKLVRNTKRIVERHPLTEGLRPAKADQWASEQFTITRPGEFRDPSMLARGITGNITGSHADVVVCDDVEVPNTSDTPGKRADLRERLGEIEYVLSPGGLQLYAGTPHSFYTIYAEEPRRDIGEEEAFLAGFKRLMLPLLDADGASPWPERFPPEEIERIRHRTGPNRFASQMLLRPMSPEDGRLDPDKLLPYDDELDYREANGGAALLLGGRPLVSASAWWDPAFGAPGKGDGSVVAAVFTDADGHYRLHRVRYLTHDPACPVSEGAQACRQVIALVRELHLPVITVETNGVGTFLPGILRNELDQAGVACAVRSASSHRAKDLRILDAFDAPLAAGHLHAHRSVWDTPFIAEMREWRPGARCRDDGMDAVSGAILSEPVRIPRIMRRARAADWRPGAGQYMAETGFRV